MSHKTPLPVDHRERVTSFLALLSSDRSREFLARFIDPQHLAFELCRVWFDELYVPGIAYFHGLKGDYSEVAARAFRDAFENDELSALERFHRFFELRVDMLRNQAREAGRFPNTDLWRNLVKDAGYLLEDLDPKPAELRRRLEEHFETFEQGEDLGRLLLGAAASGSTKHEGEGPDK